MTEQIKTLLHKAKSQQKQWKRPSNQVIDELIKALEEKQGMINVNAINMNAKIPSRGSDESAGLDLHTVESVTIPSGQHALLKTGLTMSMPRGYVGLIWPRSKLASKMGIDILAGVVDSDYRGEIHISLLNTGPDPVEIKQGDKVAQLIIQKHYADMQINIVDDLDRTSRGHAGILSSEMRLR